MNIGTLPLQDPQKTADSVIVRCLRWIEQYIRFHKSEEGFRHPALLGAAEVEGFLTHLAVERHVSASTQNQALSALLFLYRDVLRLQLSELDAVRARRSRRLPVVLSREEVALVLEAVDRLPTEEPYGLMARLLYGAGLRLMECCRLRVKDVDFARLQVVVRQGKGDKDRIVMLPLGVRERLAEQVRQRQRLHERDLARGFGRVALPDALEVKYPAAPTSLEWQFVFASRQLSRDPRSGELRRHHVFEGAVQRAITTAVRALGLNKRVSCHTAAAQFRHPSAGAGLRHSDGSGAARSRRCQHNHDLHARQPTRGGGRAQPSRRARFAFNPTSAQPPSAT